MTAQFVVRGPGRSPNILKPVGPPAVASWGVEPGDAVTAPMQVRRLKNGSDGLEHVDGLKTFRLNFTPNLIIAMDALSQRGLRQMALE